MVGLEINPSMRGIGVISVVVPCGFLPMFDPEEPQEV